MYICRGLSSVEENEKEQSRRRERRKAKNPVVGSGEVNSSSVQAAMTPPPVN